MARAKQPAVRRESSSEYFNKSTASWEKDERTLVNGGAKGRAVSEPAAGLLQLVVSVAGIYASL